MVKSKKKIIRLKDESEIRKDLHTDFPAPKALSKIQVDLLTSFLVGHWKEIAKSEHRVAFERILKTLNLGAPKAVKHLAKGDSNV